MAQRPEQHAGRSLRRHQPHHCSQLFSLPTHPRLLRSTPAHDAPPLLQEPLLVLKVQLHAPAARPRHLAGPDVAALDKGRARAAPAAGLGVGAQARGGAGVAEDFVLVAGGECCEGGGGEQW